MQYRLRMSEPVRVFAPEVNEHTEKWGVYAIPKMWREADGSLIVRFGGEQDDGFARRQAPNLYFCSLDEGEHWEPVPDGETRYDLSVLTGIHPPYLRLKSGETVALRYADGRKPIGPETPHIKEYTVPNGANVEYVYRYGDIPEPAKGMERVGILDGEQRVEPAICDFPEREVALPAKALSEEGDYVTIPVLMRYNIFATSDISGLNELADGTLVGIAHGQNPAVSDRQCEEIYLMASSDGGRTWKRRSTIASDIEKYPNGFGGDGGELSLTVARDGTMVCAMRMELSVAEAHFCDTMIALSEDGGFHWCEPFSAAESSVTPHVLALKDAVVLVYGRPGVHFRVSCDCGRTWSAPHSLIGRTLSEERARGVADAFSKYYDTVSYSNTFVEKVDEESFVVLYNSLEKFEENGRLLHKAAFVRRISVTRAEAGEEL